MALTKDTNNWERACFPSPSEEPNRSKLENVAKFLNSIQMQFNQLSEIQRSMKQELAQVMELKYQIWESLTSAETALEQTVVTEQDGNLERLPSNSYEQNDFFVEDELTNVPFEKKDPEMVTFEPEIKEIYPIQAAAGDYVSETVEIHPVVGKKKPKKIKKFKDIFNWSMFKRKSGKQQGKETSEQSGDYCVLDEESDDCKEAIDFNDYEMVLNEFQGEYHKEVDESDAVEIEGVDVQEVMIGGDGFRVLNEDEVIKIENCNPQIVTEFSDKTVEVSNSFEFNDKLSDGKISEEYQIEDDSRMVYVEQSWHVSDYSRNCTEDDEFVINQINSVEMEKVTEQMSSQSSSPLYSAISMSELECDATAVVTIESVESAYESLFLPSVRGSSISQAGYQKTPLFNFDPVDCVSFALQSSCSNAIHQSQSVDKEHEFSNPLLQLICAPKNDVCGLKNGAGENSADVDYASSSCSVEIHEYDHSFTSVQSLRLQSYMETPIASLKLQNWIEDKAVDHSCAVQSLQLQSYVETPIASLKLQDWNSDNESDIVEIGLKF